MPILQRIPAVVITAGFVFMLHNPASLAAPVLVPPGEGVLARAITQATDGDTLQLLPGVHEGPVVIHKSISLQGRDGATIKGAGQGTVITVDAPDVEVVGITITGSGRRLSTEDSGIFVTPEGDRARIIGNRIDNNLIGVYLKGPEAAVVSGNTIYGRQDMRVNERGNGVQLWNTPGSIVKGNDVRYGRDGIFVTTSRDNTFSDNRFSDLRFAVHYMYTNDSSVTGNMSRGNKVGYALMYSKQLKVQGNQSVGDSERGIFFNFTNDSTISDNVVKAGAGQHGPQKCVFVYNSNFNNMYGNHFEACQIGIHFTAGSEQNFLWENNFIANRNQVKYVGTRELEWSRDGRGNYWSDHLAFDLDGDGTANQPYRPNSISDQILWRYPMAKLLMNSPVLQILQWAQSEFPALHPGGITDSHPLMTPRAPGDQG